MIKSLFAYGTLQFPAIQRQLLGRVLLTFYSAQLVGYRIGCIERADYPGIVPADTGLVYGRVYSGLSGPELQRLDQYEGELYQRKLIEVQSEQGQSQKVWGYVVVPWARHRVLNAEWDPQSHRLFAL